MRKNNVFYIVINTLKLQEYFTLIILDKIYQNY